MILPRRSACRSRRSPAPFQAKGGSRRRLVENHKVAGVILTRTLFDDKAAEYLKQSGMPFVVIGSSPDKELIQIDNDHLAACSELTSILLAKGYRRMALLGGDGTHIITETRRRGFELAYKQAGLKPDADLIYMGVEDHPHAAQVLTDVMKKGVDVVSAYTIWIHHEEEEGVFDFSGQRDLRAFLALIQKCGLKCFLRIGPWVHGEVRNGGFPDWLFCLRV